MNAVPLALKLNRQPFADSSASGVIDDDAVLEFGDAPALGMKRRGKHQRAKKKQGQPVPKRKTCPPHR